MKKLSLARNGYIVISVIFYLSAVVYLLCPGLSGLALCCFSGGLLIAYGIIKIVGFFSEDLYCLAFRYDFAFGLLMLTVGVLVLIKNASVAPYLTRGLGWLILIDSLLKIQMSKEARDFGLENWKTILVIAIVTSCASFLLVINVFPDSLAARILTSLVLLTEGFLNHYTVLSAVRYPKKGKDRTP